jgi:anti-anti-sigma regulatory factor
MILRRCSLVSVADMQAGRILAASQDGAYVIRLVGDVRLTLCTTMDDFFQRMFADPDFASVWVDLCEAEGLDSTTLGLLAKLALQVKASFGFVPAIYSCDPGINRLLKSMAFDRLFELHEESCRNPEDIAEIPSVSGSEESVKQKVIEAHRVLMGISDENRARFKDLMSALERS